MRAAVCREFGQPLVIEDLHLDPVGPDEVRVEVAACAICHSDIHYADGSWGGALPAVYGHEAAGTVADTGRRIVGCKMGSARPRRDIERIVAWHRDGALKLEELVSDVYPLQRINDAIAEVKRGEAIRNAIAIRDLGSP